MDTKLIRKILTSTRSFTFSDESIIDVRIHFNLESIKNDEVFILLNKYEIQHHSDEFQPGFHIMYDATSAKNQFGLTLPRFLTRTHDEVVNLIHSYFPNYTPVVHVRVTELEKKQMKELVEWKKKKSTPEEEAKELERLTKMLTPEQLVDARNFFVGQVTEWIQDENVEITAILRANEINPDYPNDEFNTYVMSCIPTDKPVTLDYDQLWVEIENRYGGGLSLASPTN
jgi:hypothetical protein